MEAVLGLISTLRRHWASRVRKGLRRIFRVDIEESKSGIRDPFRVSKLVSSKQVVDKVDQLHRPHRPSFLAGGTAVDLRGLLPVWCTSSLVIPPWWQILESDTVAPTT